MFDLRVPESLASLPGRLHVCQDDDDQTMALGLDMKVCRSCQATKHETEFPMRKEGYRRNECKACCAEKANNWCKANRGRVNQVRRLRKERQRAEGGVVE